MLEFKKISCYSRFFKEKGMFGFAFLDYYIFVILYDFDLLVKLNIFLSDLFRLLFFFLIRLGYKDVSSWVCWFNKVFRRV